MLKLILNDVIRIFDNFDNILKHEFTKYFKNTCELGSENFQKYVLSEQYQKCISTFLKVLALKSYVLLYYFVTLSYPRSIKISIIIKAVFWVLQA